MKIKVKKSTYSDVLKRPKYVHKNPMKQPLILRKIMSLVGNADFKETDFTYSFEGISGFPDEPCLILMNHSSFIDLEIIAKLLKNRPYSFVATSDGFVGKEFVMRLIGCIPTNKFVSDITLVSDITYALKKNKADVVMYPEASYSFDGTATPLPRKLGVILKRLDVPVIMITTEGAFARDPLYNCLQKRKVKVTAKIQMLFSRDEIKEMKVASIDSKLDEAFSFDNFKWQSENKVEITEEFRADGLERILFKCPYCLKEGELKGSGTRIKCSCGVEHELDKYGQLIKSSEHEVKMPHIPDWYNWQRQVIRKEIMDGTYKIECDCRILVLRDLKAIYDIGQGHLVHDMNGFRLTSDAPPSQERLNFKMSPKSSYSLYADYFWYELGDIICIGNNEMLFYCFPEERAKIPVAKARIATEEMYKLLKLERNRG